MGYATHVEKSPGSIDGLCGRRGNLILRDPALHRITCSGCIASLKKRAAAETNEALLMENFKIDPDPHNESLPPPLSVSYDYVFTFRSYSGAYAFRGTSVRWVVYQNEQLIGRITKKNDEEFVAYKTLDNSIGGTSTHDNILDACMSLSVSPPPRLHDAGNELRKMLAELQ